MILRPENGGGERMMGSKDVLDLLGVLPRQVPDWLALAGDEADGIPRIGAPRETKAGTRFYGFTAHRAAEIVSFYGSLAAVLDASGEFFSAQECAWLDAGRDRALLNLRLATLREDAPVEIDPRSTRVRHA
jgi:5'-3' exonuclease